MGRGEGGQPSRDQSIPLAWLGARAAQRGWHLLCGSISLPHIQGVQTQTDAQFGFYFVFSASNAAKPEEFPRKPLGLELSLNPVAIKENTAANGQNGQVGEHTPDREPHPHRVPGTPGEMTVVEARNLTFQGSEAAEATNVPVLGGRPLDKEGQVEPIVDGQPSSLLKASATQAQQHLLPTILPPEQPLLAPGCAVVDHGVSLHASVEHSSLDSSLQNRLAPPDSSTTELSAMDQAVWQPNAAALPAGEQASSLSRDKVLEAATQPLPAGRRRLSCTSQSDGSPENEHGEEVADDMHCRAVLPDKMGLKHLASKAASTGELLSLRHNGLGSATGTTCWPEAVGALPVHRQAGGSVPTLSSRELEAPGLVEGCPAQQAPSPLVEGNSPYVVIKTTTPLHLAHATEQDFVNRKQVALPLSETGHPLPTTSMPPPLTPDPEEEEVQKSLQKPSNALKAPRPPLSPKPKFVPQVAKSRSENSFLSGSPSFAKLPKSVTF